LKTFRYHLVGIGGIGMSAIARVLLDRGFAVSGSDLRHSKLTEQLSALGAKIFIGHDEANLNGADAVVFSSAVKSDNPEVAAAVRNGLQVLSRGEMLGKLMQGTFGIAVAGTHGKTTTTGMVATVLSECGLDPTVLLGGEVASIGGNAKIGKSNYFVTEACEAYGSFLHLHPNIAVVTNIDEDHLDFYKSIAEVKRGFLGFLDNVAENGCAVVCTDCPNVRSIISNIRCKTVTYGLHSDADLTAVEIQKRGWSSSYRLVLRGKPESWVVLNVPGMQNIQNSLAAVAVGIELGLPVESVCSALAAFGGVSRRFEKLYQARGIILVDDYAHHPTEISATLDTCREWFAPSRLITVFQPHLYSRTQQLVERFVESFKSPDWVIVTDIYPARENPIPGITGEWLAEKIREAREPRTTSFVSPKERIVDVLKSELVSGDMVVFMGAGDIRSVGAELAGLLASKD